MGASLRSVKKERTVGPAPVVEMRSANGASAGRATLDPTVFAIEPNMAVMHQVVNAQLAAARSGTHSTKTRAEVSGGGAKPWRQKGTGRARAGSLRSPIFSGGGVAHGPKPRSYRQKTPKKMVQLALRSALSDRAAGGKVVVVDSFGIDTPSTKAALAALASWDISGKVLLVLGDEDESVFMSFRNVPTIQVIPATELNAFDILRNDYVVFARATVPGAMSESSAPSAAPVKAKTATTTKPKTAKTEPETETVSELDEDEGADQ